MRLSLCAIAWNEEPLLAGMLESARGLVDEIVLGIDSRTTDATPDIGHDHGARCFFFDWHDSFSQARNLTLEWAKGDWIVVLDADERLLPAGRVHIREALDSTHIIPFETDGYRTLIVENDSVEPTSARLFRNVPDLRYMGRVHEEVRYLPDPPRTYCDMLPGGPHIQHLGTGHRDRDRRLLHLRLRDNPEDAVAYCYLALMARKDGRRMAAKIFAKRALECGPRTLHDERIAQLERMLA